MNIALAQLNYHIGNFEDNFSKIREAINNAKEQKADLVIFAELAVCGYPPLDFLEFDDFIVQCENVIQRIKEETQGIAVIIGSPSKNPNIDGKRLYNSAYFIADGDITSIVHKTLLPNHDVFNEFRYFETNNTFELIEYKGKKIALTICEDLWNLGDDPLYKACPMDELISKAPDFMVSIAASPFDYYHAQQRIEILKANTKKYHLPIFYVNHIGGQTELIFDGGSLVMSEKGNVIDELPYFDESLKTYSLEEVQNTDINEDMGQPKDEISLIFNALVIGIRDYFQKTGLKNGIVGLSGGLDSAVTTVLAAAALGKDHLKVLLMPSEFSSQSSLDDATLLAENLEVNHQTIPINTLYDAYSGALKVDFMDTTFDVTEQNIQARIRGNLLMAFANKFNYILLNTSNKSELAVGYGTLYGDLSGGLSVLGDVYKSQVYDLSNYINREKKIIPQNIIDKPPTAELRPDQKDTDDLPPYELLDKILFQYIEKTKMGYEIIDMGFDEKIVKQMLARVNSSEYKRSQTAPILRISPKAFGIGRRMPIVAKYPS